MQACFCSVVYVYSQSIYFYEPLKVGHLPYLFLGANVAKIIRCASLQSWSFFLSHCKFYSVFSRKRFTWPGLFRTLFIFSDWFLHVSFSRFQYFNLQFGSLLHSFINCLCYWAFVCKGFLPLTFAIHLRRTTVRPCIKLFIWFLLYVHKGRSHYLPVYLQRMLSLFPVLFTKDRSPCLLLFICKGPQPLCCGIHSQRTAVLSFAIHLQWTTVLVFAIHLQRTAVLVWCYLFAKDRHPCLMLFICKGLSSLSYVIHLQRTAVLFLCYSFAKDRGTYFVPLVCRENCCSCYPFIVPARQDGPQL